jgi:hypothetical protein
MDFDLILKRVPELRKRFIKAFKTQDRAENGHTILIAYMCYAQPIQLDAV